MASAQAALHQDRAVLRNEEAPAVVGVPNFQKEFICPEESMGYASSLEHLVLSKFRGQQAPPTIIEFGSGTGEALITAIQRARFSGLIHGYEINPEAAETADRLIDEYGLTKQYIVHPVSFFETTRIPASDYLIANPPYIPCENSSLLILPGLCGGKNGNSVSKKLLSAGYKNVFLEVSSYSNPVDTVVHALSLGYKISDFLVAPLPFGNYSRQDIVQDRLQEMQKAGTAFFSRDHYLVGSAFFTKANDSQPDLSEDFLKCLTALGRSSGYKLVL
jgi:hypothetical protein